MGEEKNQEDFSSASAHPQKLAPSILFLACQHLPVQNPMLPSTSFDTEASKHCRWLLLPCQLSPVVCCRRGGSGRGGSAARSVTLLPPVPLQCGWFLSRLGRNWSPPLSTGCCTAPTRETQLHFLHFLHSSTFNSYLLL